MSLNNIHLKTFRDGVYDAIKMAILKGELPLGQRLIEKELVREIGTSRTPIREAIIKLEQEGLVERSNGKGSYFVSSFGKQHVEDLFGVREVLETFCISLAMDRINEDEIKQLDQIIQEEDLPYNKRDVFAMIELDTKFHEILYRASGNYKLYEILSNLRDHLYRYRAMSFRLRERRQIALSNHKKLLSAIKKKDSKLAKKLILDTISRSKAILLEEITD
jgi:DNA-binding GntR family transcriptional regulator